LVFDDCSHERTVSELFRRGGLAAQVAASCHPLDESLREEQLLVSSERCQVALRAALPGLVLTPALGGAKLLIALAKGRHNVGFLIAMAFVGLVIMVAISRVPRITARGREYLKRLQMAFGGLKSDTAEVVSLGTDPGLTHHFLQEFEPGLSTSSRSASQRDDAGG
ncbi:MAG: TIGR04222 domain-containing membrane protein, partial [Isosphaeraceae bacterium]